MGRIDSFGVGSGHTEEAQDAPLLEEQFSCGGLDLKNPRLLGGGAEPKGSWRTETSSIWARFWLEHASRKTIRTCNYIHSIYEIVLETYI